MHQSVLNCFNNKALLQLDPLVSKGFTLRTTCSLRASLNIHGQLEQQKSELLIKLWVRETKASVVEVILDLLSEEDLFFHYRSQTTSLLFEHIKQQQEINSSLNDFPDMIAQLLKDANLDLISAVLNVDSQSRVHLTFQKQANYKQIRLLTLQAVIPEKEISFQLVAYRYSFLKTEIEKMSGRIQDVREMLKFKNPQLLLQFDQI